MTLRGGSFIRVSSPPNLDLILQSFVRKILREQPNPENMYQFAADYFDNLLNIRDRIGELQHVTAENLGTGYTETEANELIKIILAFPKPSFALNGNFSKYGEDSIDDLKDDNGDTLYTDKEALIKNASKIMGHVTTSPTLSTKTNVDLFKNEHDEYIKDPQIPILENLLVTNKEVTLEVNSSEEINRTSDQEHHLTENTIEPVNDGPDETKEETEHTRNSEKTVDEPVIKAEDNVENEEILGSKESAIKKMNQNEENNFVDQVNISSETDSAVNNGGRKDSEIVNEFESSLNVSNNESGIQEALGDVKDIPTERQDQKKPLTGNLDDTIQIFTEISAQQLSEESANRQNKTSEMSLSVEEARSAELHLDADQEKNVISQDINMDSMNDAKIGNELNITEEPKDNLEVQNVINNELEESTNKMNVSADDQEIPNVKNNGHTNENHMRTDDQETENVENNSATTQESNNQNRLSAEIQEISGVENDSNATGGVSLNDNRLSKDDQEVGNIENNLNTTQDAENQNHGPTEHEDIQNDQINKSTTENILNENRVPTNEQETEDVENNLNATQHTENPNRLSIDDSEIVNVENKTYTTGDNRLQKDEQEIRAVENYSNTTQDTENQNRLSADVQEISNTENNSNTIRGILNDNHLPVTDDLKIQHTEINSSITQNIENQTHLSTDDQEISNDENNLNSTENGEKLQNLITTDQSSQNETNQEETQLAGVNDGKDNRPDLLNESELPRNSLEIMNDSGETEFPIKEQMIMPSDQLEIIKNFIDNEREYSSTFYKKEDNVVDELDNILENAVETASARMELSDLGDKIEVVADVEHYSAEDKALLEIIAEEESANQNNSVEFYGSRSSRDVESLDEGNPFISVEVKTAVQDQSNTLEEEGVSAKNDFFSLVQAAETIQKSYRAYLNRKKHVVNSVNDKEEKKDRKSHSSSVSTSTEADDQNAATTGRFRRSSTMIQLSETTLNTAPDSKRSQSFGGQREEIDGEVWNAIEMELQSAASKIQHGYRSYRARKRLRRENAVQIRSSEDSSYSPTGEGLLSTGELHDTIVLD